MSTSTIEKKIAGLVALGVDALQDAAIPPSVAQECARRWLVAAARDAERARAREIEHAAAMSRLDREARTEKTRLEARAWLGSQSSFDEFTSYDVKKFLDRVASGWDRSAAYATVLDDRRRLEKIDLEIASDFYAELDSVVRSGVDRIIEERAAELEIEWTAALLTTTVSLPDGSRVEWGEATREQHAARLEMLAKHAAGELETAARHRAAIDALDAAGVRCLNELEAVLA